MKIFEKKSKGIRKDFGQRLFFFGRNSSIHGLRHLFRENAIVLTRIFWLTILLTSIGCMYLILAPVIERNDQVNFTPDTRYLTWQTTFPAVTVCETFNYKTVQRKFAAMFPDLMEPLDYDFRKYLTELIYGQGTCSKSLCIPCGSKIPCDVTWRQIIDKVHKKCSEILTECRFNDQEIPCCRNFREVDSEYGVCYSFNSLQSENPEHNPLYTLNTTTGPGNLTFRLLSDASVSVHSPEDLSTNFLDSKFKFAVKINTENRLEFLFSIVEMQNDPALLAEEVQVRGCRYLYEVPDEFIHAYKVYSYGACRLAEETENSFLHCGCIHPVRQTAFKKLYCNYTGLNCLVTYEGGKRKLGNDREGSHDHGCVPSCEESELTTIHISRSWVQEEPQKGSLVNIRMITLPTLRYKRNLVRTDLDLVVSIGGIVGLFFAASVLSIVEIMYLICRPQKKRK